MKQIEKTLEDQSTKNHDIQGHFLLMPYDFRLPTWSKIKNRLWEKNGSMFRPRVWGMGWTLNFAHIGTWILLLAVFGATLILSYYN